MDVQVGLVNLAKAKTRRSPLSLSAHVLLLAIPSQKLAILQGCAALHNAPVLGFNRFYIAVEGFGSCISAYQTSVINLVCASPWAAISCGALISTSARQTSVSYHLVVPLYSAAEKEGLTRTA